MIRNVVLAFFGAVAVLGIFMSGLGSWMDAREQREQREAQATAAERARAAALQRCTGERRSLIAEHQTLTSAGQHLEAGRVLVQCAEVLQDSELRLLQRGSEIAALVAMVNDPKDTPAGRLAALSELRKIDPEQARSFESLAVRLRADAERAAAAAAKTAERERLAKAKKEGVRIGMTKQQVLESSWGRPDRVNRNTNAYGVMEQWVYDDRNFLYFDGDRLTSIQN